MSTLAKYLVELGVGFVLGLEEFFGLGTIFCAKGDTGTGYAVLGIKGAAGAIGALIQAVFRLHVLSLSELARYLAESHASPLMGSRMVSTAFCPLFE